MATPPRPGRLWLGTQGFAFDDWVGPFYPPGTPRARYLEAYAQHFPTVEVDSTFYGAPRRSVVEGWRARTPESFLFSAKFPRSITHDRQLTGAESEAQAFVEVMSALGEKLAVLTLQFAYDFTPQAFEQLDRFLGGLPPGPRYAVEVRNRKWLTPEFRALLSGHRVALVLQDLHYMPKLDWISAGFTVIRWLGRRSDVERFDRLQIDRGRELMVWSERVQRFLSAGIDLFGYFNNHFAGHSPASARMFEELVRGRR